MTPKGCHSKNVTESLHLWPHLGDGVSSTRPESQIVRVILFLERFDSQAEFKRLHHQGQGRSSSTLVVGGSPLSIVNMVKFCSVWNCTNRYRKNGDVTIHAFPVKDKELLKKRSHHPLDRAMSRTAVTLAAPETDRTQTAASLKTMDSRRRLDCPPEEIRTTIRRRNRAIADSPLKDKELPKKWERATFRTKFNATKTDRVSSSHLADTDCKRNKGRKLLLPGSVPSLMLGCHECFEKCAPPGTVLSMVFGLPERLPKRTGTSRRHPLDRAMSRTAVTLAAQNWTVHKWRHQ